MAFDGISPINSASSGRRRMGIPPFELAHRGELNGCIPIARLKCVTGYAEYIV